MLFGAFVGFFVGFYVRAKITGDEHGAQVWQKPGGDFVDDIEGFVRWLSIPIVTATLGALIEPVLWAMVASFVAGLSILGIAVIILAVLFALFAFFRSHVLGRPLF